MSTIASQEGEGADFGLAMLTEHFPHMAATGVPMLNTGSYGITPKSVLDRKNQLIQEFESYGDNFVRQRLLSCFTDSVKSLAALLNLRPANCTLVDNVTTGMSTLLDRLVRPGDAVLVNSWTYGTVKYAAELAGGCSDTAALLEHMMKGKGKVHEVKVPLPLSSFEEFVSLVKEALDKHSDVRVAVFDHITSATACLMPVKRLTELCHSRGVLVIIDGAHAIGQVPNLDIESIGADFYIGNLHKWMFAPKSAALLWVSDAMADKLKPLIVSWLVWDTEMSIRFAFLGTRDTSSLLAVSEAVAFVKNVCGGLDRIHAYCSQLADAGSQHLVTLWRSQLLPIPADMQAPCMRVIAMPEHLQDPDILAMTKEFRFMSPMWKFVLNKLKKDVVLMNIDNRLYIRVSFAVIVCMDDIKQLGETMMKLTKKDFTG